MIRGLHYVIRVLFFERSVAESRSICQRGWVLDGVGFCSRQFSTGLRVTLL